MANSKRSVSKVEETVLRNNNDKLCYKPTEKLSTVIVDSFPALGKLAALRFIEWAQLNAGWTIALPTGKTPEHFIKWVSYFLKKWETGDAVQILETHGIDPAKKPDMQSFHFVQIDEFYPINSWQSNSFYHYVNKFYIDAFNLDPQKALLINPNEIGLKNERYIENIWSDKCVDLSLRTRHPRNAKEDRQKYVLDAVDQFCTDYEKKIRQLDGIGFFLGGIGPDGHIGFNVQGSDHYSSTRLTQTNYETQAAAASDLGGIEVSRQRLVITIGLQTIVYNPNTTAIVIAAGEAKAEIVRKAIESTISNDIPASILQELVNATFYITRGAAKLLGKRRYQELEKTKEATQQLQFRVLTDLALSKLKRAVDLTEQDLKSTPLAKLLQKKSKKKLSDVVFEMDAVYEKRILNALDVHTHETFLHTAPHHDDIMLAYLPFLVRLMRDQSNDHYFNYLTSGFTAVTNSYMVSQIDNAREHLRTPEFESMAASGYFNPKVVTFRNRDVFQYLDGLAGSSKDAVNEGNARRFLRNLVENYGDRTSKMLKERLQRLTDYFSDRYPGKKDEPDVQKLKGMLREWEADILWGYFGFSSEKIIHSRLGFYQGEIFTEEPELDRDVLPVLKTLRKVKPTIVTVALDPEGSGPDTHYKVLQAVSTALKIYREETKNNDIEVWGYRNVWYRYHPSEANLFIPVTMNGMAILQDSFLNSFISQAEASFPSHEFDGPFSGLAKKIQVEQYQYIKTVLGRDFFYKNPDSRIRSTRGLVFLKTMNLDEFFETSRELRKTTENM